MNAPLLIKHHIPGVDIASVYVWAPGATIRAAGTPAMGATLKSCTWADRSCTTYDAYVFKGFQQVDFSGDRMLALFVKPIGGANHATPSRTYASTIESHYWPEVLTSITFNHTEVNGGAWSHGGNATQYSRWAIVAKRIGAYRGLTAVTVEEFIDDTPWDSNDLANESLHPSRVSWDLVNDQGTIPECLHGSVSTPTVYLDGTSTVIAAARTFGATPQTTWVDHYIKDDQVYRDGYWFRTRVEAHTPPSTPGE